MGSRSFIVACLVAALGTSAGAQTFQRKLVAADGAADDWFGQAVGVAGDRAVVGALNHDHLGLQSGSAYLFDTSTGIQVTELLAFDGTTSDSFGISVAIDGGRCIVGAYQDSDKGAASGSVYVFDATSGVFIRKLTASDGAAGDIFGVRVAVRGDRALVGASGVEGYRGAAYLFDLTTGQELLKLTSSDRAPMDQFGFGLDFDGDRAIVLSPTKGTAYVFDLTTGQEIGKINGAYGCVSIDANRALLGSPSGGVAVLRDLALSTTIRTFTAADGFPGDGFGGSVALRNGFAIVAAHTDNDDGLQSGSAYLFDAASGWQIAKLKASDGGPVKGFGCSIATDGQHLVSGAWGDATHGPMTGAAYSFGLGPPQLVPYGTGCYGTGGVVPSLGVTGSPTPGGQLQVTISNGVGGGSALMFIGLGQAAIPMGFGCMLNVAPVLPAIVGPVPLFPIGASGPGAGSISFPGILPANTPVPLTLTLQAMIVDAGGKGGFSNTNGFQIEVE